MKYKFKVPIGDWSSDGHSKCDEYILCCNYSVETVRQAYKDSCSLTGVQFNHNEDYTGIIGNKYGTERHICTEYDNPYISQFAYDILVEKGLDLTHLDKDDDEDYYIIGDSKEFLDILMNFIKLSLPDLEFELMGEDLPYLNGYWNKELNVQFGYGLFD